MLVHFYLKGLIYHTKKLFWLLLLCPIIGLKAQVCHLSGKTALAEGSMVSVYGFDDLWSAQKVKLAESVVSAQGHFSCHIGIEEIQRVEIRAGRLVASMFLEPQASYEVEMPSEQSALVRTFDRSEVDLSYLRLDSADVNALIADFNIRADDFIAEHYTVLAMEHGKGSQTYKSSHKSQLKSMDLITEQLDSSQFTNANQPSFVALLDDFGVLCDSLYAEAYIKKPFFRQYVFYGLSTLKLGAGESRKSIFARDLDGQPILYGHPEYMDLVARFYKGLFSEMLLQSQNESVLRAIRSDVNIDSLRSSLSAHPYFGRSELGDLGLIYVLSETYHKNSALRAPALELLKQMSDELTLPEEQHKIISNMLIEMARAKKGYEVPEFRLSNARGDLIRFSDFRGKHVLVVFYAAWCNSCLRELLALQPMVDKYGREMEFIAISMDDNYLDFQQALDVYPLPRINYLYGAGDDLLVDKWALKSVPAYYLIDPAGKLCQNYTAPPSGSLSAQIAAALEWYYGKPKSVKSWAP